MNEHVTRWLDAYHDGELSGRRLQQVEEHLAGCEACRAELEALSALSSLLQESLPIENLMQPERFVAQVGLQLPRRPERTALQQALETGWRLIPVGLLGTWAFVQTLFVLVTGLFLAQSIPLGQTMLASIIPPGSGVSWLDELECFTGSNNLIQAALCTLGHGGPLGWAVTLSLIVLVSIGLLYWSWLASWWLRQAKQPARLEQNHTI